MKKRSNRFFDLAFSGRHYGMALWVLTQQLTSIAKPFRDNVACIIYFYSPNEKSIKTLFEEYGGNIGIDTKNNMLKILKSEPYSRICFSLRHISLSMLFRNTFISYKRTVLFIIIMAEVEEIINNEVVNRSGNDKSEIDEKRESLSILASTIARCLS